MRSSVRWELVVFAAALSFLTGVVGYGVGIRTATERPTKVDVGFFQDMIAHHEQAVEMAVTTLDHAQNPTIRDFAQEVVIFQNYEIGLMEGTLRSWGKPREGGDSAMGWMGPPVPVDAMPGLATPDQMKALADAQGSDADALFVAMMSVHHLGGVAMADAAAKTAGLSFVRDLAARMARNQATEVREYGVARRTAGLPIPAGFTDPPTAPAMPGAHMHPRLGG
jgi:uncharacterized protein (DUF305 family)